MRTSLAVAVLLLALAACTKKELREEKYPNGQLKSRGYVTQDKDKNYVKTGLWTEWHQNGQKMSEMTFKDGRTNGPIIAWYENGQKKLEQIPKSDDTQFVTNWYTNGKKAVEMVSTEYVLGTDTVTKENGPLASWYENGNPKYRGVYKDGKSEGLTTIWRENGQKAQEGNYRDDKKEGVWTFWDENGKESKELYRNGEPVKE